MPSFWFEPFVLLPFPSRFYKILKWRKIWPECVAFQQSLAGVLVLQSCSLSHCSREQLWSSLQFVQVLELLSALLCSTSVGIVASLAMLLMLLRSTPVYATIHWSVEFKNLGFSLPSKHAMYECFNKILLLLFLLLKTNAVYQISLRCVSVFPLSQIV